MVETIDLLTKSRRVVALTGVGISSTPIIPYTEDYFNEKYRDIFSIDFYQSNVQEFYKYYSRLFKLNELKPNIIHLGLAKLGIRVITQNIDHLHELAGSNDPIHLHGKINELKCTKCKLIHKLNQNDIDENSIITITCSVCNNKLRPNIVLFGEPVYRFDEAVETVLRADFLLVLGTSLNIWPANNLVQRAQSKKCEIVQINETAESLFSQLIH